MSVVGNFFRDARSSQLSDQFGSNLGGKLAAGGNFGSIFLKDSIARGKEFEGRADALAGRNDAQVANVGGKLARLRSGANTAAQIQSSAPVGGPRGFSRALDINTRRGKARQGIENRGENAVRNQQLKDRITQARAGLQRRGDIQQTSANVARLRAGDRANVRAVNSQVDSAFAGAAGAVAGGAIRGFGGNLFGGGDPTGMTGQQADVDSFFGAGAGDVGGLDVNFDGGFDFGSSGGTVFA